MQTKRCKNNAKIACGSAKSGFMVRENIWVRLDWTLVPRTGFFILFTEAMGIQTTELLIMIE